MDPKELHRDPQSRPVLLEVPAYVQASAAEEGGRLQQFSAQSLQLAFQRHNPFPNDVHVFCHGLYIGQQLVTLDLLRSQSIRMLRVRCLFLHIHFSRGLFGLKHGLTLPSQGDLQVFLHLRIQWQVLQQLKNLCEHCKESVTGFWSSSSFFPLVFGGTWGTRTMGQPPFWARCVLSSRLPVPRTWLPLWFWAKWCCCCPPICGGWACTAAMHPDPPCIHTGNNELCLSELFCTTRQGQHHSPTRPCYGRDRILWGYWWGVVWV